MSNEELIAEAEKAAQRAAASRCDPDIARDIRKAFMRGFDFALATAPAPSPAKPGDAVSREAVLGAIDKVADHYNNYLSWLRCNIAALPAVAPSIQGFLDNSQPAPDVDVAGLVDRATEAARSAINRDLLIDLSTDLTTLAAKLQGAIDDHDALAGRTAFEIADLKAQLAQVKRDIQSSYDTGTRRLEYALKLERERDALTKRLAEVERTMQAQVDLAVGARNMAYTARDAALDRATKAEAERDEEERAHTQTLEERDSREALLDKFVDVLGGSPVHGEHSSMNCPWRNALEYAEGITAERDTAYTRGRDEALQGLGEVEEQYQTRQDTTWRKVTSARHRKALTETYFASDIAFRAIRRVLDRGVKP